MNSSTMSYSSTSSTMNGNGRSGRSVSTRTYIDANGRKTTKTETTIYHQDGSVETKVDETFDDTPQNNRLNYSNEQRGGNNRIDNYLPAPRSRRT
jgi:hypothetical protein